MPGAVRRRPTRGLRSARPAPVRHARGTPPERRPPRTTAATARHAITSDGRLPGQGCRPERRAERPAEPPRPAESSGAQDEQDRERGRGTRGASRGGRGCSSGRRPGRRPRRRLRRAPGPAGRARSRARSAPSASTSPSPAASAISCPPTRARSSQRDRLVEAPEAAGARRAAPAQPHRAAGRGHRRGAAGDQRPAREPG